MYLLVNASSPEPLNIATSISQVHRSHDVNATGQHLV